MKDRIHYDYPYRLRILHSGNASLRIERKGRWILVDPVERPTTDNIVVLTNPGADRVKGTWEATKAGVKPTVIASEGILTWLREAGNIEGSPPPQSIDGVQVTATAYSPQRTSSSVGDLLRMGPATAVRQLAGRSRLPTADPQVTCLTFEDQSRMLHLDLSLHRETPESWLEAAIAAYGGADWVICGVPHGEADAVVRMLPAFKPKKILLTEMVNTERKRLGMPIELVTPTRDRLLHAGLETHVFAPHASYRFE